MAICVFTCHAGHLPLPQPFGDNPILVLALQMFKLVIAATLVALLQLVAGAAEGADVLSRRSLQASCPALTSALLRGSTNRVPSSSGLNCFTTSKLLSSPLHSRASGT